MYKSMLQELCKQRQWGLPRYTSVKDGPDHNPCFKASVFLNGTSFHSSVSCKCRKEAENDAAQSAFLHFGSSCSSPAATPYIPGQEVGFLLYKNLLHELTQREELSKPEYKTTKCGLPHRPTFFSRVEVEGEVFYGEGGKSRKEAETNAAKVAYTNLTERLQVRSSELCSSQYLRGEPLKSLSTSNLAMAVEENEMQVKAGEKVFANSTTRTSAPDNSACCSESVPVSPKQGLQIQGETLKSLSSSDLSIVVENEEHAEEINMELKAVGGALANATSSPDISSSCSRSGPVSLKGGSLSSVSALLDISALSISDSNRKKDAGLRTYLLNNRFRVYPCFPDITFPKGITVLPISEDKWVAVSLEFPNEKDD